MRHIISIVLLFGCDLFVHYFCVGFICECVRVWVRGESEDYHINKSAELLSVFASFRDTNHSANNKSITWYNGVLLFDIRTTELIIICVTFRL